MCSSRPLGSGQRGWMASKLDSLGAFLRPKMNSHQPAGSSNSPPAGSSRKLCGINRATLLILGISFGLIALGALLLLLIARLVRSPGGEGPQEVPLWGCTSLQCSLNSALDPCEDFYEFVCSGFVNDTGQLPAEYTTKSQFNILWHKSWTELIGLLNNRTLREAANNDGGQIGPQMFHFYDACLDSNGTREGQGARGLLAHLRWVGYSPGMMHALDTQWLLTAFPFVPFFNLESTWDIRPDTKGKSMFLLEPKPPLWSNYGQLRDEQRQKEFGEKMARLLRHLLEDDLAEGGGGPSFFREGLAPEEYETEIQRRVESLVQMEMRIGKALDSYQGQDLARFTDPSRAELYVPLNRLAQLSSPSIDWLALLRQRLSEGHGPVDGDSPVLVLGHGLLQAYREIVDQAQREEPQMLSDYLDWALIWRMLFELDSRFGQLLEPWRKDEVGCIRNFVRVYFKHWLDRLYVENVFDRRLIPENERILSYVKRGFAELLDEVGWMDGRSRQMARQKLAQLKENIGYFRLVEDDQLMARLYGGFGLEEGMPWAQMFGRVHRQFYLWPTMDYQGSYWVDGFYKWVYNSLAIYAGIIQPPWFDPAQPPAINFGAMGTFMGHEVTHGFDSFGWHFDGKGNKRPEGELDNGTMERMARKMDCFVGQYGHYEGEPQRPNALFTLAENIADNGGIRASHRAWQSFNRERPEEGGGKPKGLEQYNEEQLFFIASAFMYCSAIPDQNVQRYARTDKHAFPRARVNLPLRNLAPFSAAFKCSAGSKMSPREEEKCRLW